MGLEEVEKDILQRIESKSKAIDSLGEREADSIIAEARDEIKNLTKKRNSELEKTIEGLEKKETAFSNLQARKINLDVRKRIMESAYSKAFVKVEKIAIGKKQTFLKALLKKGRGEIDAFGVYTNAEDKALLKKLAQNLKHLGNIETSGGFILVNKEGSVQVDYTFETIFEETQRSSLKGVSDILFGK
ncbi:MAG: V-type ATP synthase subunit E family protein [archaeon]|nr:V-type ATP synthase subunit E family protein [archaeon]